MKRSISLILWSVFLGAGVCFAATLDQAEVIEVRGEARYLKESAKEWKNLKKGVVLTQGDRVKTAPNSQVVMNLSGVFKTAEVLLRKESEILFAIFEHNEKTAVDTTQLELFRGGLLVDPVKMAQGSRFEVKTPTSLFKAKNAKFDVHVSRE